jgi:hypothetical protein
MTQILRKFLSLTGGQKKLLAEAAIFLYTAKLLLLFLHVKTVLKITFSPKKSEKQYEPGQLKEIRLALLNADRLSLWKNRCLVQSIAGRWMLQRRGIGSRLSLGVDLDKDKKLIAHAWLKAGDFEMVEKGGNYQELSFF